MTRRLPPLNALKALDAMARLGSMSAAAAELHVTHGAVSRQLAVLEAWLGAPVFEQAGRRLRLTATGAAYAEALGTALDGIGAATQRFIEAGSSRQLVVNSLPTLAMRWLMPRLTRFQRAHPTVELRLITSDASPVAPGFDVAIRRQPADQPGTVSRLFLEEREGPVCAPALLAREPLRCPADLARHTLLEADTRPGAWLRWLAAAGVPGLAPAGRQRFDHFYLVVQAAADGLGIALGPTPLLADDLASGRLVAPLPEPQVAAAGYCWVLPQARRTDALCVAFCRWLEAEGRA
jgi:LysR family glycine cleavage system transcriptional activator